MRRSRVARRGTIILASLCAIALICAGLTAACGGEGVTSTSAGSGADTVTSQAVTFTTSDDLTLSGHLFGTGNAGVILAHMYPADQTSWYPTAERLAQEGYLVLTFDFRGYGDSQGDKDIEFIDRDMLAAILYIASAGADRVVLIGASMGGTACLVAGDTSQVLSQIVVTGVATLSAPVEFRGLSAKEAAPRLLMPLLFVAAEDDVGAEGATELQRLAADKGDLRIVPGDDHGTDLLGGAEADKVWALLLGFLQRNLPVTATP